MMATSLFEPADQGIRKEHGLLSPRVLETCCAVLALEAAESIGQVTNQLLREKSVLVWKDKDGFLYCVNCAGLERIWKLDLEPITGKPITSDLERDSPACAVCGQQLTEQKITPVSGKIVAIRKSGLGYEVVGARKC